MSSDSIIVIEDWVYVEVGAGVSIRKVFGEGSRYF